MQFIAAAHDWIAAVARERYKADGRGMIQVEVLLLPLSITGFVATDLVYYTLDEVRSLLSDREGASRQDAEVLLRMIETYEPSRHAVVNMTIEGHNLISIKMKLERPNVQGKGVH